MNLVLIGYRCTGKTVTGRLLAERLKRPFVDTDTWVVREAGAPVSEIVRNEGWERFRDLESQVIRLVSARDGLVVSTGGGAVLRAENVRLLRANGWLVWLRADVGTLRRRMRSDAKNAGQRPGFEGEDPAEDMAGPLRERAPLYRKAGDFHVDTDRISPFETTNHILRFMPI